MTTNINNIPDLQNKDWDMVIEPQRSLLDLRLGELWRYKDLVMLFVRRDFVAVYKQTILGPLWYLIQPLMTAIIFTFIFGNIASLPTDGLPNFLFPFGSNTPPLAASRGLGLAPRFNTIYFTCQVR